MSNLLRKALRPDLLIIFAYLLLPLLIFGDVTVGGQTMLPVDNLYQWQPWQSEAAALEFETPQNNLLSDLIIENYIWKKFTLESLRGGEIPLWNPYLFAGAPFLANGQHSMYYPLSLLFVALPLATAYGWFTLLNLWIAGICGHIFGRVFRQSRSAALITGLVYQGAGFLMVRAAIFPMILAAAAWLPLLLACVEMIVRVTTNPRDAGNTHVVNTTLPWVTLGALGIGLVALAGHPEILLYTLLIMGLYAAWRLVVIGLKRRGEANWLGRLIKPSAWLLSMVALGLILGAVQLFPQFELAQTNFRDGETTLAEVRGYGFPERRVLTLLLPNFFGNPAHHTYTDVVTGQQETFGLNAYGNVNPHGANSSSWGIKNYVEGGIYLGILPLLLAGVAIIGRLLPDSSGDGFMRRIGRLLTSPAGFFLLLSFAALNFIFGSPLYAILYYGLPFFDQLHSPFRWIMALTICVAALSGNGYDTLVAWAKSDNSTLNARLLRMLAWLVTLGGAVAVAGTVVARSQFATLEPTFDQLVLSLAQAGDAFANGRQFYSYLHPQFMALSLAILGSGVVLMLLSQRRWLRFVPIVAFVVLSADMAYANAVFHAKNDPGLLAYQPQLANWLQAQQSSVGEWRLTSFAPKDKAFNANSAWLFNIEDVRGYDSIINRQYTEYMAAIDTQDELDFNRVAPIKNWESLNSPLLDLLNVRYVVTSETLNLPKLQEVWAGEGVRVYENLAVMPRAWTLPQRAAVQADAEQFYEWVKQVDPRSQLFVDDPNAQVAPGEPVGASAATITAYGNVEVTVDVTLDEAGYLVLADSYANGWRAFARPHGAADDKEAETDIFLANGNFRAVALDAGEWTVRFRYSPRSFIIGGLASFMGGIVVVLATGIWAWRRFYRQEGELTNTQSIAKNSVVPMALNLFNKAIDFAFAAFYLRVLGPGDSGAYATAISIALWFDIVANWGLDALIIRDVSQEKERAGHYLLNTTLLRAGTIVFGFIPVVLFMVSGERLPSDVLWALGLIMAGMVISGIGKGITGLFYVFESAEYPALLATVTTILKVVLGVAVLLIGWGFVGLAGVSILTNIITLFLLARIAFRKFPLRGPWKVDFDLQKRAFLVGYPLMLNHLLATVFFKIDQPLLYRLDSEEATGWYNSAYKWVDGFNVIPSFFTFALFPIIARQVSNNISDARRTFRMAVKLLVLTALPLAATVTLLSDVMIGLVGGSEFLPHGSIALRLVIWSIPIGWINSVTNYMIVSLGLEKRLTFGFIVGVLFNTIGNLLLIGRFSYQAAAITTILSELILLIMFNRYLREKMEDVQWFDLLWRPIVVTSVMLIVMLLGAQIHLVVGLLLGLLVYPIGLWLLRVFGEEEKNILSQILPERIVSQIFRTN